MHEYFKNENTCNHQVPTALKGRREIPFFLKKKGKNSQSFLQIINNYFSGFVSDLRDPLL